MSFLHLFLGGTTIALIAVAIFAPAVLTVLASWLVGLTPLIKGAAEFIVSFTKLLWAGAVRILDDGAPAIVFVITAVVVALLFGPHPFKGNRPYYIAPVSDNCVSGSNTPRRFSTPKREPARSTVPGQKTEDGFMPWWSRPN
jgi:hypothetical protein